MTKIEYRPSASLSEDIQCMWVLEEPQALCNLSVTDTIPDAYTELIINCGAPIALVRDDGGSIPLPLVFLNHMQSKPLRFQVNGECQILALRLYPWALFRNDGQIDSTSIFQLDAHWNSFAHSVRHRFHTQGHRSALGELQQFFVDHSVSSAVSMVFLRMAGQSVFDTQGQLRMTELATQSHFSISQVERLFKQHLGATPKHLSRLVRFRAVCNILMFGSTQSPDDLAQQFGYTDQSHFIHDFKRFAARTPGAFVAQAKATGSRWQNAEKLLYD